MADEINNVSLDTTDVSNAPVPEVAPVPDVKPKKKKSLLKPFIIIFSILAIIAIALFCVVKFVPVVQEFISPKLVAKNAAIALCESDFETLSVYLTYDYFASAIEVTYDGDEDEFYEDMSDFIEEDVDSMEELYEEYNAYMHGELEYEYGDYKITAEVVKIKDISGRKMSDSLTFGEEFYEEMFGINFRDFSDFKVAKVIVNLEGSESDKAKFDVYLGKRNNLWEVIAFDYDDYDDSLLWEEIYLNTYGLIDY